MNNEVMFSSKKHDWETPGDLFDAIDSVCNFTLDVCANNHNAKCERFFSPEDDGLSQDWSNDICWMNPPYGREIKQWVEKARKESEMGATVVALLPSRTDTRWFHDNIYHKAHIIFLKGRITFVGGEHPAPFPSMIVVWNGNDLVERA